jgi:hypothetical protein
MGCDEQSDWNLAFDSRACTAAWDFLQNAAVEYEIRSSACDDPCERRFAHGHADVHNRYGKDDGLEVMLQWVRAALKATQCILQQKFCECHFHRSTFLQD